MIKKVLSIFVSFVVLLILFGCEKSNFYIDASGEYHYNQAYVDNLDSSISSLEEQYSNLLENINKIALENIQSNVTIYVGNGKGITYGLGSGVIIKQDETKYYLLTNNHVVQPQNELDPTDLLFRVVDHVNKEYTATLLFYDSNYDLALLSIDKKDNGSLMIADFANSDVKANDYVFAVGQHGSQKNAVTIGKVTSYVKVIIHDYFEKDIVDISFEVISHKAAIKHGSSGGALFNTNLELCGINFAGSEEDAKYFSIPITKVKEFLNNNNFIF